MHLTDSRGFLVRALQDGRAAGWLPGLFAAMMTPLAFVYACAMRARRRAYGRGLLRAHRLDAPVISVGNITSGGAGKTPMVEWVVRWLLRNGRKPAILSRGYGAKVDAQVSGKNDEAAMLGKALPGVPHYTDPDRVRSGGQAVSKGADVLVLDDGFQHMRLHRDVNLLLIDALDMFGRGRTLPAGTLREPLSALRCADAIVLTRVDTVPPVELISRRDRVRGLAPDVPVLEAAHTARGLVPPDSGDDAPADRLAGRKTCLFCGVGNPRGVLRTVERLGAQVVSAHFLPDHCSYSDADLARIAADCDASDAEIAVTTEKDAVKIGDRWPGRVPLRALRVEIDIVAGKDQLESLLAKGLCR